MASQKPIPTDLSGRLAQVKERSGDTFTYTYDSVGRITRKDLGDGTYEQFTYDSAGRVATVRDVRGGTTTLTYDTNNQLTKIAYLGARFLSFAYDAVGRRTQMVDQAGFTTNYSYDAEGRLSELKNASGARIVAYTYDSLSRLSRETNGNGTYTSTTAGTVSDGSTFREVEGLDLLGGSGNDTFNVTATTYKSWVRSGTGNDTVSTGSGDDRLEGGDGDDILRGGAGWERGYNWYFTFGSDYLEAGLYGGNGNDQLFGESGNDNLFGEAGNDTLNGGDGNDVLNGGAGGDRFLFDTNAAFNNTIGIDAIADFLIGTDKIVLDKTTFTALTSAAGNGFTVSSEFARVTTDTAAATSTARIVYNSSNGKLFYNQNSSTAGFGTGAQFATLTGNPLLNASDFVIQT